MPDSDFSYYWSKPEINPIKSAQKYLHKISVKIRPLIFLWHKYVGFMAISFQHPSSLWMELINVIHSSCFNNCKQFYSWLLPLLRGESGFTSPSWRRYLCLRSSFLKNVFCLSSGWNSLGFPSRSVCPIIAGSKRPALIIIPTLCLWALQAVAAK